MAKCVPPDHLTSWTSVFSGKVLQAWVSTSISCTLPVCFRTRQVASKELVTECLDLFLILCMYVCLCLGVCVCMQVPVASRRGCLNPRARVIGIYELPGVCAENKT